MADVNNNGAVAELYRKQYGWPVFAVGTIVWTPPGQAVQALNMPRPIGEQVQAAFHIGGITAPIINIPGPPDRWAFLTRLHNGPAPEIEKLFDGHDIGYASGWPGSSWGIDLPPTCHPGHEPLSWLNPPDCPIPELGAVLAVLLPIINGQDPGEPPPTAEPATSWTPGRHSDTRAT